MLFRITIFTGTDVHGELLASGEVFKLKETGHTQDEAITEMLMRQDDAQLDVVRAEIERQESLGRLMDDMQFEIDLLGMSAIEQEKAIALRYAGVDAISVGVSTSTKLSRSRKSRRPCTMIERARSA